MKNNKDGSFSLKAELKDMAENTTLHGVPKIISAKRVHMKILWAILFVGLSCYLTFSLYQLFGRTVRRSIGHSIEDMLISCSFEGRKCDKSMFNLFQSNEYGNCFSLEHNFNSVRSGPTYGLWLTLNLEVPEYIKNYASGYGIKLVIHEPETYAFPSDEGMIISSGQETIIGLRMINLKI
ncbi:hypothetical protein KUTeg_016869 [Tegillarca granosa]|uniref:Uncharacterized protein n=1 Tax=Tegillarca granosa TaxID=220873 RepID=A0ABQ9EM74_TEGGR|nr:hypothetical protein KUTeg_016869 [Tegillarca granosa]